MSSRPAGNTNPAEFRQIFAVILPNVHQVVGYDCVPVAVTQPQVLNEELGDDNYRGGPPEGVKQPSNYGQKRAFTVDWLIGRLNDKKKASSHESHVKPKTLRESSSFNG